MEVEDCLVIMRRENAVLREQVQTQTEQISNLTLALDDALALVRKYRGGNQEGEEL
jgi:hypothetical protein